MIHYHFLYHFPRFFLHKQARGRIPSLKLDIITLELRNCAPCVFFRLMLNFSSAMHQNNESMKKCHLNHHIYHRSIRLTSGDVSYSLGTTMC